MSEYPALLKRRRFLHALLLAPVVGALAQSRVYAQSDSPPPLLPDFLAAAELQIETDVQRKELARALADLQQLPLEMLRETRYADYQGQPGEWSARRILRAYFLSPNPMPESDCAFYDEIGNEEVRKAINAFVTRFAPKLTGK